MLVLKRKAGEVIRIGDEIEVHVLDVEGDVVKLGFKAPKDVRIMRQELYEAIRIENAQAGMNKDQVDKMMQLFKGKPGSKE